MTDRDRDHEHGDFAEGQEASKEHEHHEGSFAEGESEEHRGADGGDFAEGRRPPRSTSITRAPSPKARRTRRSTSTDQGGLAVAEPRARLTRGGCLMGDSR